ncbi:MAG: 4-hydroxythreonine-4-phosphate dehydrogenase PdxA [Eubacteriales bacterium]|nr:4-hydroxythreonine-4-phosphate dehydrogenase PdxA [Eubacteriales bacterium]
MTELPILVITAGDPAGAGPEITVKAFMHDEIYKICRPLVIGDLTVMEQALQFVGLSGKMKVHAISNVKEAVFEPGVMDVYDMNLIQDAGQIGIGTVNAVAGEAAFQYVVKAIDLAMKNEVDATITNAISKEAINMAGHHYSGHTEIYADYTNTKKYCMMLAHNDFRVTHVSTHVSLREACNRCKKERILDVIEMSDQVCRDLGIENPKIAVAGLNPHCGEHGMFGTEEIEEITPAIEAAKEKGIQVTGPCPPDSVFSQAIGGWYDIVVCQYHDQGHIPTKVQGFVYNKEKQCWNAVAGVNITLGLPIIRVSVDHGTAYDHAGKGDANELSLINSIEYGAKMAGSRRSKEE